MYLVWLERDLVWRLFLQVVFWRNPPSILLILSWLSLLRERLFVLDWLVKPHIGHAYDNIDIIVKLKISDSLWIGREELHRRKKRDLETMPTFALMLKICLRKVSHNSMITLRIIIVLYLYYIYKGFSLVRELVSRSFLLVVLWRNLNPFLVILSWLFWQRETWLYNSSIQNFKA